MASKLGAKTMVAADTAGAAADLFGRNEDLPHIFPRLAMMLLQFDHAVLQPSHILHHARNFGTNEVGRLPHAGVFEDLLHHLDRQHQQRR